MPDNICILLFTFTLILLEDLLIFYQLCFIHIQVITKFMHLRGQRFYSAVEPLQGCLIPFEIWCINHTSGSIICCCRRWAKHPVHQLPSGVCVRSCDIVAKCPIPLLTLCCPITPKDDQATALYKLWITFSYCSPPKNHHGEAVRGGNLKHFKTSTERARHWTFQHCVTILTNLDQWLKDRSVIMPITKPIYRL